MSIQAAIDLIQRSNHILFITGAGMSAESGLPTYRGITGLYENIPTDEGMPIEEALSLGMLKKRPEVTWKYLWEIGIAVNAHEPNRGHFILAEIEKRKPKSWVLTQNVDGYHQKAGTKNIIEIHGNMRKLSCIDCSYTTDMLSADNDENKRWFDTKAPPQCPWCDEVLRPSAVLFGEYLPPDELQKLVNLEKTHIDLVVSIGTTSIFPYISGPVIMAKRSGVPTIEINPGDTEVSDIVDFKIRDSAVNALKEIWHNIK